MNKRAVWILAGLLMAGCAEGVPTDVLESLGDGTQRLEARAVFPHPVYYSGVNEASRQVVRTDAEWQALWAQVHRGRQPMPSPTAVDLDAEMVIVAAMGMRATGGYAIKIDSVAATPGAIHVFVTERSPGRSCGTTQAVTAPVDAVAIPDDGRPVQFHESTHVHSCG